MTSSTWLRGRPVWLLAPILWSNLLTTTLLVTWGLATEPLKTAHQRQLFVTTAAGLAVLVQLAVLLIAYLRLRTFRGLAAGRLSLAAENRLRALGELRALPGTIARYDFAGWAFVAGLLGVISVTLNDATLVTAARITLATILGAPIATTLVSLLATSRSWEAFDRLSEGLKPADVIRSADESPGAIAAAVDWSVRGRTVIFTLVFTLVPVALLADIAWDGLSEAPLALQLAVPQARVALADELFRQLLVGLAVPATLAVAIALIAANAAGRTIAGPMQRLADDARRMTDGTMGEPRVIAADGEVWRVTGIFAQLSERLATLIDKVVDVGLQVRSASESLQQTSTRSEATATEQAAALNETSATTEELARSARQIAKNAGAVEDLAKKTLAAAEQGRIDSAAFQAAVDRMKQDNKSIAGAVDRLQRRVQQIGRIVELINTVADRSDLLALSAELEGSRAGEVGRGFSMVGSEMRRLAENVLESTSEVEELIAEIREATVRTAEATETGSRLTEHGMSLAADVTGSLTRVAELAQDTATRVRTITLSTQQQQSGTDQLAESMGEILRATRAELDGTHRAAEVNKDLISLANSLQADARRFLTLDEPPDKRDGGGA
ncbi:MAG: methyl-accepting chemotaxis protein [Archangium sp.]|nr:methyl-accepting chemotaxis protein [Archangium sp.]